MCKYAPPADHVYGEDLFAWYANVGNGEKCLDECALTFMSQCFLGDNSQSFIHELMMSMDRDESCCIEYNEFCT